MTPYRTRHRTLGHLSGQTGVRTYTIPQDQWQVHMPAEPRVLLLCTRHRYSRPVRHDSAHSRNMVQPSPRSDLCTHTALQEDRACKDDSMVKLP